MLNWLSKKIFGRGGGGFEEESPPSPPRGTDWSSLSLTDYCINALWSKEDDQDISDEFSKVREQQLKPESFQDKLERRYNDQTVHFEKSGKLFEPLHVTPRKYDLVTLAGMGAITELITGRRSTPFTHYADGTGTTTEAASDTKLQNEHFRVSMVTDGFAQPSGASARFAGKFPFTAPTATITEGGVFDALVGGTMLFRTVFPSNEVIVHTQYSTVYTLTQTVSMISIT